MRKKIWRMSEGQFEESIPSLTFEPEKIQNHVIEGMSYKGSFHITSANDVPIRGLVYSTHPYVYTATPAFNGLHAKIEYEIITDHLKKGDTLEGEFIVICNNLQTSFPFYFTVGEKWPITTQGTLQSMEDFAALARRQWREALRLFYSESFAEFVRSQSTHIRVLYRGFAKAMPSSANLEEFLAGAGLKDRMSFDVDQTPKEYSFLSENIKESVRVTRSTWGYIEIRVSSDADFVTVEKEVLTSDFFLGTELTMNFYIHKERLHDGRNYAVISFDGMGQHKEIKITASTKDFHVQHYLDAQTKRQRVYDLWRQYESYRCKVITKAQWSATTIERISEILSDSQAKDDTTYLRLLRTQAMIVGDRRQDALWQMKQLRKDIADKRSMEWAYLLYLGALMEPEESYVRRLTAEIESIFRDHPEDVRIFWFLLFLREEYRKDPPLKLKAIRQWIMAGYDSPALFVEVYDLFSQDPYLLSAFDTFSVKVLNWARKRGLIKTSVADRFFDLIGREEEFRPEVFRLIEEGYRVASRKEYLNDILTYLMRFKIYRPNVIHWYELAVEENLKLTGLYEGYVYCLPLDTIGKLPTNVARYFVYESNVSYERKALVYANIISSKAEDYTLYEQYLHEIRSFCIDQMRLGRMDDNLAIIYQDLLDTGYLDIQIADLIADLLHSHKVICLSTNVQRVIVIEDEMREPYIAPVKSHAAYVIKRTENYRVFLEMNDGRIVTDDRLYYIEPMLHIHAVWDKLRHLSDRKLSYFLTDFDMMESAAELTEEHLRAAEEYLLSPVVDPAYVLRRFPTFVAYFRDHEREEILLRAMMHESMYEKLDTATINYLIELLILADREEEAEKLLREYLGLQVDQSLLLRLMQKLVLRPREQNGEFILEICIWLLRQMYYSQETLKYLNEHYIGSTDDMMLIFQYADHHETDVSALAERILVQMLYTERMNERADDVFMAYCESRSNTMIIEAYLTYWSYRYLMYDEPTPPSVFAILYQQERVAYGMNDVCRFGLMKYLSLKQGISNKEMDILDSMVGEQISKGIYFSFYRLMEPDIVIKYHLYDKLFAEYRGEPQKRMMITYRRDKEDEKTIEMVEMFNGIYVRQFVIFFGETIHLKVYDDDHPDIVLYEEDLVYQDVIEKGKDSRFGMLNRMESAYLYRNDQELEQTMEAYQRLSIASDLLFKPL